MPRVLIVDDEQRLADGLKTKLVREGFEAATAYTGKQAIAGLKASTYDVCVLDIRLPDIDGIDLLGKLKDLQPDMEVIMLTGFASLETAVQAMKMGAYDYLAKPYKLPRLQSIIAKAYEKKSLQENNTILREQLQRVNRPNRFIGETNVIRQLLKQVALMARSDATTLVLGETGTGKELIARAIHDMSARNGAPFVAINSSTLQDSILESELFGYKKGAFTGADADKMGLLEIANRGTFFIDEVGDMSLNIQAKLLRVLETGLFRRLGDTREYKIDVRFVCATNKDLDVETDEKRFRRDLLYRLNVFMIVLPPLRDRRGDIPLLVNYFLRKFSRGEKGKQIEEPAMKLLAAYDWPGNVRELANVLERATLLSMDRNQITLEDLPESILRKPSRSNNIKASSIVFPDKIMRLEELQKAYIQHVLGILNNNKVKTSELLGISRTMLYNILK